MRLVAIIAGAAALAFAHTAAAAPVTLAPVSFSPEFQEKLDDDLGAREGEYLRQAITEQVAAALADQGATLNSGAPVVIEVSIVDADPNRPTIEQLSHRPGLDMIRSISVGGAELRAVLRQNGTVIAEVDHRRYNHGLQDLTFATSTWSEARRSIRQFAIKVADAYVAHAR